MHAFVIRENCNCHLWPLHHRSHTGYCPAPKYSCKLSINQIHLTSEHTQTYCALDFWIPNHSMVAHSTTYLIDRTLLQHSFGKLFLSPFFLSFSFCTIYGCATRQRFVGNNAHTIPTACLVVTTNLTVRTVSSKSLKIIFENICKCEPG